MLVATQAESEVRGSRDEGGAGVRWRSQVHEERAGGGGGRGARGQLEVGEGDVEPVVDCGGESGLAGGRAGDGGHGGVTLWARHCPPLGSQSSSSDRGVC